MPLAIHVCICGIGFNIALIVRALKETEEYIEVLIGIGNIAALLLMLIYIVEFVK